MKKLLLISFVFISAIYFSQENKIDSLISTLENTSSSREKIKNIHTICWSLIYSYTDSCFEYCNQALKISQEINNDSLIGKSYNLIGIVHDIKSEWDKSLIHYDSAFFYAIKSQDSGLMAGVHNNNGLIYWNTGKLKSAINEYVLAEKIFIKIGKQKGLGNCYNNIALIQIELRNGVKALKYNYKALKIRQKIKDEAGINYSKLNIAGILISTEYNPNFNVQSMEKGFNYLGDNEEYYSSVKNYYALGKVFMHKASYFNNIKKYDSAVNSIEKAIKCYKKIGAKNLVASTTYNSNFYFANNNQKKKAKQQVKIAYRLASETGSNSLMYKIKHQLAQIYLEEGKYKESATLFQESRFLQDSIYSLEKQKEISLIEEKYESEKKQNEINYQKALVLTSDKEKLKAELSTSNKQKWIYILILLMAFFGLFSYLYFRKRRRDTSLEKEKAIQVEKEKGLKSVIESQEKERNRIAKNLHDSVIQQLVSLKLELNSSDTKNKDQLIKLLDNSTFELRDLSHRLMPKNLEKFGLKNSINNLLETSLKHTQIDFTYDFFEIDKRLPKDIEINLYRTIQELIHNVIKHSKASKIDAQLYKIEDNIHFIFEDNGIGFDSKKGSKGIGLQSIKSRIESINGMVNYESIKESGTIVTIKIPIN
jgi:signal transduction histidine kinase